MTHDKRRYVKDDLTPESVTEKVCRRHLKRIRGAFYLWVLYRGGLRG